jgi:polar amino acid transport system permease protein
MEYMAYFLKVIPFMLEGMKTTVSLGAITLIFSLPLGLIITLCVRSNFKPLAWLTEAYIYVMRGTPLMLQLMFLYYSLPYMPVVGGFFRMNRFLAASVAFILNYSAYFGEIFRGGLLSVSKGQYEACQVLGLNRWQTMSRVIMPQMFRVALPSVSNEVITLVKDTALAYVIALPEIMHAAKSVVSRDANSSAYLFAALLYLGMTFVLTVVFKRLERRYSLQEK